MMVDLRVVLLAILVGVLLFCMATKREEMCLEGGPGRHPCVTRFTLYGQSWIRTNADYDALIEALKQAQADIPEGVEEL